MKYEDIKPHRIIYMRRTGVYGKENFELMAKFKETLKKESLFDDESVIYGISWDSANMGDKCRYDVCTPCEKEVADTLSEIFAGGKYAVIECAHTPEGVAAAWKTAGTLSWDMSRPPFERYKKRLVDVGKCELCVPVK